jgi:hypothetical protein
MERACRKDKACSTRPHRRPAVMSWDSTHPHHHRSFPVDKTRHTPGPASPQPKPCNLRPAHAHRPGPQNAHVPPPYQCFCRRQSPCQPVLGVSCPTTRLRARPPRLPWNRFFVSDLRHVHHQLAPASSPSHPFHAMLYCAFCNASDSPPCHVFPCSPYSLPCTLFFFFYVMLLCVLVLPY